MPDHAELVRRSQEVAARIDRERAISAAAEPAEPAEPTMTLSEEEAFQRAVKKTKRELKKRREAYETRLGLKMLAVDFLIAAPFMFFFGIENVTKAVGIPGGFLGSIFFRARLRDYDTSVAPAEADFLLRAHVQTEMQLSALDTDMQTDIRDEVGWTYDKFMSLDAIVVEFRNGRAIPTLTRLQRIRKWRNLRGYENMTHQQRAAFYRGLFFNRATALVMVGHFAKMRDKAGLRTASKQFNFWESIWDDVAGRIKLAGHT
jgi:hypothetical protein